MPNKTVKSKATGNRRKQATGKRQEAKAGNRLESQFPIAKNPPLGPRQQAKPGNRQEARGKSRQQAGVLISSSRKPASRPKATSRKQPPKPISWPWGKWMADWLGVSLLFGFSSLVAGGAWVSVQLIVDPNAGTWLNELLPEWSPIDVASNESLQTWSQIEDNIRKQGLIPGEAIPLPKAAPTDTAESDLLLPIIEQSSQRTSLVCPSPCQEIVELRVYESFRSPYQRSGSKPYFRMVNRLFVQKASGGFHQSSIFSSMSGQDRAEKTGAMTNLRAFQGNVPQGGVWFNLSGQQLQGNKTIPYGQIIHYNPTHNHLSLMLEWKSQAGQAPIWQEITGGGDPELVVEQTIGLDPHFDIYQVKPQEFLPHPIKLEAISLDNRLTSDRPYRDALRLARSGLWSPALTLLEPLQEQVWNQQGEVESAEWLPGVKAQLDSIQFHALITRTQANAAWASPSQKVLAGLLDGRWSESLKVFEADLGNTADIVGMLKIDSGRLWNRVDAALRVDKQNADAKVWGALILASQEGPEAAIAWLNRQPDTSSETKARVDRLLELLERAIATSDLLKNHQSQIVGSVSPLPTINSAEWVQPAKSNGLKLSNKEVWYRVRVASFHNARAWRREPFSELQSNQSVYVEWLWQQLGFHNNPEIQIGVWTADGEQKTTVATVKALKVKQGSIEVLAAGKSIVSTPNAPGVPQPIALTASSLEFLQPTPIALETLSRQNPRWVVDILPAIWVELQAAGLLESGPLPPLREMAGNLGNWVVQAIDLTGNNLPELMLTVDDENLASLGSSVSRSSRQGKSWPRTMIFSDTGVLIYSEFTTNSEQFLTGLANLGDGGPVALVLDEPKNYTLQRWSGTRQRFE